MSSTNNGAQGGGFTRRSVLKGVAAGGAATIASGFGIRFAAAAPSQTLTIATTPDFKLADAWKATSEPAKDSTYLRASWGILQNWKKKHPEIQLEFDEQPWDQASQNVILAAQSGTQKDVVMVNDLNIPKLARGGFLLPIDQFSDNWADYNQNLLRGIASLDGKIYAAPYMTDCRHEFYWKSMYQKAGITEPAKTWAEFKTQLVALKATGIDSPYSFFAGNSVHTPTMSLLAPLWMLGGDVLNSDGHAVLNTPEMVEVFDFYNSLMNVEKVASPDLISVSDGALFGDIFESKKNAAQKNGAWVSQKLKTDGFGDEVGFFRTPRPTADAPDATLSGFWAFELPVRQGIDDARQELAAEFALHMSSAESQAIVVEFSDGLLPTRPSVNGTAAAKGKDAGWQFQAAYAAEAGRGMPPAADATLLFDQMTSAFQRYLSGQQSAKDALTGAESKYNSQAS